MQSLSDLHASVLGHQVLAKITKPEKPWIPSEAEKTNALDESKVKLLTSFGY